MKAILGKFAIGVDLIVCAISDYYVASLWVNGKTEIQSNSLKTNIILLIEVMLLLSIAAYGTVTFLLKQIYIYEWGIKLSFWGYEKKIEWEDFTVIQRYDDRFFFNILKQKDGSLFWCTYHPFTSIMIFDKFRGPGSRVIPISADEFCDLLTSYGVKYTENK